LRDAELAQLDFRLKVDLGEMLTVCC
jgi:hypothetical protein